MIVSRTTRCTSLHPLTFTTQFIVDRDRKQNLALELNIHILEERIIQLMASHQVPTMDVDQ